jgi:uncharacterized protein (TIGR03437 family)
MTKRLAGVLAIVAACSYAADFQNGQAARAVIGQPSFSSRDGSFAVHALTVSRGRLNAADSNRLLTFDLSAIPAAKDDLSSNRNAGCAVCGFTPLSTVNQSVFQGVAASAVFGKTIVVADQTNHRVLIWRGTPGANGIGPRQPEVILGRNGIPFPVSASTLIEPISVAFDGKRLFVGDAALHRVLVWNSLPATDDQPADAVLGQPDFTAFTLSDTPGSASLHTPSALASDGTNLFVGDSADHRILLFSPGDLSLPNDAVINSASLLPAAFAPGTLITIKGSGLSESSETAPDSSAEALPFELAGAQVYLNGSPLPVHSVSPEEIQVQLPYDLKEGTSGSLWVRTARQNGAVSVTNSVALRFAAVSPGIFAFGGKEPRAGLLLHAGGNASLDSASKGSPISAGEPARSGEVITVWATGLGLLDDHSPTIAAGMPYDAPDANVIIPVHALVDGQPASVLSAILPQGAVGIYEVRVLLPRGLPPNGTAKLILSQNNSASNVVTFPFVLTD